MNVLAYDLGLDLWTWSKQYQTVSGQMYTPGGPIGIALYLDHQSRRQ